MLKTISYVLCDAILTGRALRKVDELRHLLDIAKMNFRQLGGVLEEDEKEREEEREHSRYENIYGILDYQH